MLPILEVAAKVKHPGSGGWLWYTPEGWSLLSGNSWNIGMVEKWNIGGQKRIMV